MAVTIRPAGAADYAAWRPLWDGYVAYQGGTVPEDVTETTFARCLDRDMPMYCFLAEDDGAVVGFMVIVLHLGTWTTKPVCYLEDLFVGEAARGRGVGRALLEFLIRAAPEQGWGRLYWQTFADNARARALYDTLARQTDWVRYEAEVCAEKA